MGEKNKKLKIKLAKIWGKIGEKMEKFFQNSGKGRQLEVRKLEGGIFS